MHLYTDEGDIDTTVNHPFYVMGKGWVAAGDLVEGDEVYNLDGTTSTILGSEIEVLDEPVLVYNLEVEDLHSYFVGCVPTLAHNECTNYDLYACGRDGGNPSGRPKDFNLNKDASLDTIINKDMKPPNSNYEYGGASAFETEDGLGSALHNAPIFKLKKETELPEGLGIKRDVSNGHNTIYPKEPMELGDFMNRVKGMQWENLHRRTPR